MMSNVYFFVLPHELTDCAITAGDAEINEQIRESNILHWQELPGRRHTERTGKIGLSAAGSTQQNDVVVLMDVVAGTETKQFFLLQLSVRQILHVLQTGRRV